jgi:uncharacterized protein (TIGR02594 family)
MVDLIKLVPGGAIFRLGSAGPAVRQFQLALAKFGYPLSGTSYFGQATDTAVTAFQKLHGLTADGVIGPKTAAMMDTALALQAQKYPALPLTDAVHKADALTKFVGRPLWLQAGINLIGIERESTGRFAEGHDNPTIIDWAKEEGGEIAAEYTHDSIPWCALFANHCLTLAGLKGTGTLWALDFAGKWPCTKLLGPAVGAFAPMVRSGGGHIIQIVGRDKQGRIMGLGGNQSDKVSIEPFPMSRLNKGFWWPSSAMPPLDIGIQKLPIVLSDGRLSKEN